MSQSLVVWVLLLLAFVAANLPWISDRIFLVFAPKQAKRAWLRLVEWVVLYAVLGTLALGLEQKLTGGYHAQSWEFYTVTFCLFLVFALPGFIYRYDLKHHLERR